MKPLSTDCCHPRRCKSSWQSCHYEHRGTKGVEGHINVLRGICGSHSGYWVHSNVGYAGKTSLSLIHAELVREGQGDLHLRCDLSAALLCPTKQSSAMDFTSAGQQSCIIQDIHA